MNDPSKRLDPELEQLIAEEAETLDKLETMSLNDIIDAEYEGRLDVSRSRGPSTIKISETDFEVEDTEDPIFANLREQFD